MRESRRVTIHAQSLGTEVPITARDATRRVAARGVGRGGGRGRVESRVPKHPSSSVPRKQRQGTPHGTHADVRHDSKPPGRCKTDRAPRRTPDSFCRRSLRNEPGCLATLSLEPSDPKVDTERHSALTCRNTTHKCSTRQGHGALLSRETRVFGRLSGCRVAPKMEYSGNCLD